MILLINKAHELETISTISLQNIIFTQISLYSKNTIFDTSNTIIPATLLQTLQPLIALTASSTDGTKKQSTPADTMQLAKITRTSQHSIFQIQYTSPVVPQILQSSNRSTTHDTRY